MRKLHPAVPLMIAAGFAVVLIVGLAIQQISPARLRYFPETDHIVREPFLPYFAQYGGVPFFGYPLTDAATDSEGALNQVFQRARIQLTVRGIELSPLGRQLHLGDGQPGHTVATEFQAYYHARGGEAFFGPPLGEAVLEGGLLVQDFERARLVRDSAGNITLAELGTMYLSAFPAPDSGGRASLRLRGTPTPPPDVRASVSVAQPTVAQGGQQTLYLIVEDEFGNPVRGAQSLAILRYGSATAEIELPSTDGQGVASATFIAPPAPSGTQVLIEMHVLIGEIFLTVETTYFQWW